MKRDKLLIELFNAVGEHNDSTEKAHAVTNILDILVEYSLDDITDGQAVTPFGVLSIMDKYYAKD